MEKFGCPFDSVSYLSKINNVDNSSYIMKEKISTIKKENHKNKDINKNNPLEINIDTIPNNTSDISGITPIKKNDNNNSKYITKKNENLRNNTKKQLRDIFDNLNKEGKNDNNYQNEKYQLSEGKNNYSKEIESLLLNNMKDIKLNQTHSSENYNESVLQNQVKELKIRSKTMKEKLTIFLKLMKKYSSKLTTLTNLSTNNNINNQKNKGVPYNKRNSINNEIQSTLSQLNNMLNNPKLNEDIFELPDLTTDLTNNNISININTTNNNNIEDKLNLNQQSFTIPATTNFNINTNTPTLSMNKNEEDINNNNSNSNIIETEINETPKKEENDYAEDVQGLINKYEEKIKLLNNENKALKKIKEEENNIHMELYNKNINLEKEVNNLKDQLKEEKINYENALQQLDSNSKLTLNIQKKVDFLEDENKILKKNCVELSQNLSKINFDKNDINELEKELEYKNNVIAYLENLLKKMNINPKLLSEDIYKKESIKNKKNNIRYNKYNNFCNNNSLLSIKNEDNTKEINNLIKNENYLTYNNNNIHEKNLNSNSIKLENNKINNSSVHKKGKITYSSRPVNISDLMNANDSVPNKNSNKIKHKNKSCEKIIKSENIYNLNNKNIENNYNEDNNNYFVQDNENSSRNYFSFYNWGQNNNNPNLVEYKKIYKSDFNSPKIIQKEIDDIDKEIVELQTRLKELLNE